MLFTFALLYELFLRLLSCCVHIKLAIEFYFSFLMSMSLFGVEWRCMHTHGYYLSLVEGSWPGRDRRVKRIPKSTHICEALMGKHLHDQLEQEGMQRYFEYFCARRGWVSIGMTRPDGEHTELILLLS